MTIHDAQRHVLEDITKPNNLIHFQVEPSLLVSAEVWTCPSRGNVSKVRFELLKQCASQLLLRNPNWIFWLLGAHKTLQPDSRIVRHHRLWDSLRKRGSSVPAGRILDQGMRAEVGGLRFFGAIEFTLDQLEAVSSVMRTEAAVVVAGDPSRIRPLVSQLSISGWRINGNNLSADVLDKLCPDGGLVLSVFGEFDDSEIALAIMGRG